MKENKDYLEGVYDLLQEIQEHINKERDDGNIGKHQFSSAICLSGVIKILEKREREINKIIDKLDK